MIAPARTSFSAVELLETDFPEPRFAVPNIVAEGLSLLVGSPKLGKSWLALNLAIAIASGGRALGQVPVERGEVLYLALEDGPRRLKNRLQMVLGNAPAPEGLHFETSWAPLDAGGADDLSAWLGIHPGTRLVVIDVIARLRSPLKERSDRYMADYMMAEQIKRVADDHAVAIAAVHHTRKAAADDFTDTVSGTNGLAGAADSIIVLRRSRSQADATMHVTGRDIEEQELALKFNSSIGNWSLVGDAREWALSEQRRRIIQVLRDVGPSQPKAVADELDEDRPAIRQTMARMARDDQLTVVEGAYSLPETLSQVSQVSHLQVRGVLPVTGTEGGVTGTRGPVTGTGRGVTPVTGVTPIHRVNEIAQAFDAEIIDGGDDHG